MVFDVCIVYWQDYDTGGLHASEIYARTLTYRRQYPNLFQRGVAFVAGGYLGNRLMVNQAHLDPQSYYLDGMEKPPEEHLISIPIFFREKVLGVFQVARMRGDFFTNEEYELVQLFVSQANIALHNALLYLELKEHADEIEKQRLQRAP